MRTLSGLLRLRWYVAGYRVFIARLSRGVSPFGAPVVTNCLPLIGEPESARRAGTHAALDRERQPK
jgi:hypothetical protein